MCRLIQGATMTNFIGVDGGGSNLRVVVTDAALTVVAEQRGDTVNPSVVGWQEAAARVQKAILAGISAAGLRASDIAGVGIGIAGASAEYAGAWLHEVVHTILPEVHVAASSDIEIALVGAHGARSGVLVLAGTGSVVLAIDHTGRMTRAGGWGYLLGDEGGGHWLGMEALRAVMRASDGRGASTALTPRILDALDVPDVQAITLWLYRADAPRTRDVARLAPLVCEIAANGDEVAQSIVDRAADELALLCRTAIKRSGLEDPPIAFAGGLLTEPTPVRDRLCELLGMAAPPQALHTPVVGAALLAQLTFQDSRR